MTKMEGVHVGAVLLLATPGRATQTLCSVLSFVLLSMTVKSPRALRWKRSLQSNTESRRFGSRRRPACWGTAECMWIKNVVGQKNKIKLGSFPVPPPHGASRTGSPSGADHHILTFVILVFSKLNSCYLCLCPSTESRHWMQHLVAKCYWQKKKMSWILIWFHNIQIFVLFIYYIYWNITLCAGM